jgi:SAM-dependent methyltransferase
MDRLLHTTCRAEGHHFWFRGLRQFVGPLLDETTRGRVDAAAILDCGSGTGANLEVLERFGRAFGVDLTWTGLQHARTKGRTRTAQASVAHLPFPEGRFDIVTSFDVLYCLPAPAERAAVAEMARVLRPGGWAIVSVAGMPLLRGHHSEATQEVRRYTRRRLRAVLEGARFDVCRLTHTNASLFPILLARRLLQRLRGPAPADAAERELALPPRPVNAALSALLALEARLVRHVSLPVGSSVLCLARKPAAGRDRVSV